MEKERFLKLLRAEHKLARHMAAICADSKDYTRAAEYQEEARTYAHIIDIVENEDHFNQFCKILKIDQEEAEQ